jgi:hypothetical protein
MCLWEKFADLGREQGGWKMEAINQLIDNKVVVMAVSKKVNTNVLLSLYPSGPPESKWYPGSHN